MTPNRVQLRRSKGWRKPEDAIVVTRASKRWGNPYGVGEFGDAKQVVALNRWLLALPQMEIYREAVRSELAGKPLACYCKPDQPCHADVLLEIANS